MEILDCVNLSNSHSMYGYAFKFFVFDDGMGKYGYSVFYRNNDFLKTFSETHDSVDLYDTKDAAFLAGIDFCLSSSFKMSNGKKNITKSLRYRRIKIIHRQTSIVFA